MKNPNQIISEWYNSQEEVELRYNFAFSFMFVHQSNFDPALPNEEYVNLFTQYIDQHKESPKEILRETLNIISLVSYTLDGKSTEEDWSEIFSRTLEAREHLIKNGIPNPLFGRNLKNDFEAIKSKWIKWADNWNKLLNSELSYKNINVWYILNKVN